MFGLLDRSSKSHNLRRIFDRSMIDANVLLLIRTWNWLNVSIIIAVFNINSMCPEMTISSFSFVKKFKIFNLKRLLDQSIKKEQEDETKL